MLTNDYLLCELRLAIEAAEELIAAIKVHRDEAIANCYEEGLLSKTDIAQMGGVSRQRIYQIYEEVKFKRIIERTRIESQKWANSV